MASFDTASKKQVETDPKDFVHLCLGFKETDIEVLEIINPEQPTIKMHQADSLIKAIYNGQEVLVHIEFQTTDSYDPEMPLRMAGYIGRAIEVHSLPIYSNVIYLRPDAGKNDPGKWTQKIKGHKISIEYQVLRLIDLDGEHVLDSRLTGLVPLTPLMGHSKDITDEQWFQHCVQVADSIEVPDKAAYLGRLVIFANLVYEPQVISKIILEETMQHSSIAEYLAPHAHEQGKVEGIEQGKVEGIEQGKVEGIEQGKIEGIEQGKIEGIEQGKAEGIEQGKAEGKQEAVLQFLQYRFQNVPETLSRKISNIHNLSQLDTLLKQVMTAQSLEEIDSHIP